MKFALRIYCHNIASFLVGRPVLEVRFHLAGRARVHRARLWGRYAGAHISFHSALSRVQMAADAELA
jgi:hypothetical protein